MYLANALTNAFYLLSHGDFASLKTISDHRRVWRVTESGSGALAQHRLTCLGDTAEKLRELTLGTWGTTGGIQESLPSSSSILITLLITRMNCICYILPYIVTIHSCTSFSDILLHTGSSIIGHFGQLLWKTLYPVHMSLSDGLLEPAGEGLD